MKRPHKHNILGGLYILQLKCYAVCHNERYLLRSSIRLVTSRHVTAGNAPLAPQAQEATTITSCCCVTSFLLLSSSIVEAKRCEEGIQYACGVRE